jgi:hypothetical protein
VGERFWLACTGKKIFAEVSEATRQKTILDVDLKNVLAKQDKARELLGMKHALNFIRTSPCTSPSSPSGGQASSPWMPHAPNAQTPNARHMDWTLAWGLGPHTWPPHSSCHGPTPTQ